MSSIRIKLLTTHAALMLLTVLLLGSGVIWFVRVFYLETVKLRLEKEALLTGELLRTALSEQPDEARVSGIDAYVKELGERLSARITLIDRTGTVLGDSHENPKLMDNHWLRPEIRDTKDDGAGSAVRFSPALDTNILYVAVPFDHAGQDGYLRLALPLSSLNQAVRRIQYALLTGFLAILAPTLIISLKQAAGFTRLLGELAEMATRLAAGDLQSRVYSQSRDELGELTGAINAMAESLERKINEATAGRDRLNAILSNMQEGIIVFDGGGRAALANPAAEKMLGSGSEGVHGRRDLEILRNPDLHEKIEQVRKERHTQEHRVNIIFPEKKTLSVSLVPLKAPQEEGGVLAVFHDITRVLRLEQMRADFAANVSHELRTPLTAIRGFAETISDSAYNDAEAAKRFAAIIQREAERLADLIEDVLALSQIESGKKEIRCAPIEVLGLVQAVTERMAERLKRHKLKVKVEENLPAIHGDVSLLSQMLYNLLDNAEKNTQQGGVITVGASRENDRIRIFVEDNGIGIPAWAQERIFERFYRVDRARSRRMGGTGLGLAIVKHIVEAHQGTLKLTSIEGKGTKVEILLVTA